MKKSASPPPRSRSSAKSAPHNSPSAAFASGLSLYVFFSAFPPFVQVCSLVIPNELLLPSPQGFVHASPTFTPTVNPDDVSTATNPPDTAFLPSLPLSTLRVSSPEVAHAFHLPFTAMTAPSRLRAHLFRGGQPYWAVGVADLVRRFGVGPAGTGRDAAAAETTKEAEAEATVGGADLPDEVGAGRGGLEVWGLTGWYLSLLMRALSPIAM